MKRLKEKRLFLLDNKLIKNITDLRNAKEHYESFLRKTNRKSIYKTTKNNYWSIKTFQNPNITDIKSDIIEHPKASNKLFKIIGKVEKVDSNNSLYSDTKKT